MPTQFADAKVRFLFQSHKHNPKYFSSHRVFSLKSRIFYYYPYNYHELNMCFFMFLPFGGWLFRRNWWGGWRLLSGCWHTRESMQTRHQRRSLNQRKGFLMFLWKWNTGIYWWAVLCPPMVSHFATPLSSIFIIHLGTLPNWEGAINRPLFLCIIVPVHFLLYSFF